MELQSNGYFLGWIVASDQFILEIEQFQRSVEQLTLKCLVLIFNILGQTQINLFKLEVDLV